MLFPGLILLQLRRGLLSEQRIRSGVRLLQRERTMLRRVGRLLRPGGGMLSAAARLLCDNDGEKGLLRRHQVTVPACRFAPARTRAGAKEPRTQ
jgi:hypothetical protein